MEIYVSLFLLFLNASDFSVGSNSPHNSVADLILSIYCLLAEGREKDTRQLGCNKTRDGEGYFYFWVR